MTTELFHPYHVWEGGISDNFTFQLELSYPVQIISYLSGFWQLLKFAWVQYLAIMVALWWVLRWVQAFVFQNQIILTVTHRIDKAHTH